MVDPRTINVGDIVYMAGSKREVEVLKINPPRALLVKPT